MELIGEYLKNQRIKRQYSILHISKELHIAPNLLISILQKLIQKKTNHQDMNRCLVENYLKKKK